MAGCSRHGWLDHKGALHNKALLPSIVDLDWTWVGKQDTIRIVDPSFFLTAVHFPLLLIIISKAGSSWRLLKLILAGLTPLPSLSLGSAVAFLVMRLVRPSSGT